MQKNDTQQLIMASDVSARLGISLARVYDLARQELLPSVRMGRSIRFDLDQLDEFIAHGGACWPGGWRRETAGGAR